MAHILLSPIGRSPGAVTGIYYALAEQEPPVTIDTVVLISTAMPRVQEAAKVVQQTVGRNKVHILPLRAGEQPSHDFDNEAIVLDFIHQVNAVLDHARRAGDKVHIGISGGRSSMGALATLSAYIYGAASVYHLWVDEEIERHGDIDKLPALPTQRESILKPPPNKRKLVAIPLALFDEIWGQGRLTQVLVQMPIARRKALLRAVSDIEMQKLGALRQQREASFEEVAERVREIFKGTEIEEAVEAAIKLSGEDAKSAELIELAEKLKPYIKPPLWEQIKHDLRDWENWKRGADRLLKFIEAVATPLTVAGLAAALGVPLN